MPQGFPSREIAVIAVPSKCQSLAAGRFDLVFWHSKVGQKMAAAKKTSGKVQVSSSGRDWTGSAHRENTAMRIEKAALKLFVKRGVEAVISDEVADAAGVARRTFYRYFETPADVLTAMPLRSMRRLAKDFRERPLDEPPAQALLNAMREADQTDEERELTQLAFLSMRRSPEAWISVMAQMQPLTVEWYERMFAQRLRASGSDASDAGVLAAGVSAIMFKVCVDHYRKGRPPTMDKFEAGLKAFGRALEGKRSRRAKPTKLKP